jgi:hypothetical protein
MTRLKWGEGPRLFDRGVDQGVLYLDDGAVPWNGLVSVDEAESGEVDTDYYFEGNRIRVSVAKGVFEGTISAYTYPDVFAEYNGYSHVDEYRRFGLSYRTQREDESTKLHIVYNVLVRDDVRSWTTLGDRPDPSLFSWDISAAEKEVPGASPASHLIMEWPQDALLEGLSDILYGTETTEPRLPEPEEIVEIYESASLLRVVYNGDGTYTVTGPDNMVGLVDDVDPQWDGTFYINAPTAFLRGNGIFTVTSY